MSRAGLLAVVALAAVAGAAAMTADPTLQRLRARVPLDRAAPAGDWSAPGIRDGSGQAVESLVPAPRVSVSLPRPDAYRIRIYYKLEARAPATVRLGSARVARLEPDGWRKAVVDLASLAPERPALLLVELPEGGRLVLRRVDYRNYVLRLGTAILVKPARGPRPPPRARDLALTLSGPVVVVLGAWALGRRRRTRSVEGAALWAAVGGLALLAYQPIAPYPLHARPEALAVVFALVAAGGAVRAMDWDRRVAAKRAALVAAGVLGALLLTEAALRLWDPPISRPRIGNATLYSPEYGWLNRPNMTGWQVGVGYHIRINRFGHRGPDYPEKKPPGVFRILGLGDSFTFGWGVEEDESFLGVMERRLREAGHRVQVINAAVAAWHSAQSLHYLRRDGVRFEPDLVVASFFVDDVFPNTIEALRDGPKAREIQQEEASFERRRRDPLNTLRLYNLWFNYRKLLRDARDYRRRNPYPTFESEREQILNADRHRNFDRDPEALRGLETMLREWRATREAMGIPIILAYVPPGGSVGAPEYQGHARALSRLARAHGFPYLDVLAMFDRAPEPRRLYLHPRDGHMSAEGHRLMGEALATMIREGGWLDRSR